MKGAVLKGCSFERVQFWKGAVLEGCNFGMQFDKEGCNLTRKGAILASKGAVLVGRVQFWRKGAILAWKGAILAWKGAILAWKGAVLEEGCSFCRKGAGSGGKVQFWRKRSGLEGGCNSGGCNSGGCNSGGCNLEGAVWKGEVHFSQTAHFVRVLLKVAVCCCFFLRSREREMARKGWIVFVQATPSVRWPKWSEGRADSAPRATAIQPARCSCGAAPTLKVGDSIASVGGRGHTRGQDGPGSSEKGKSHCTRNLGGVARMEKVRANLERFRQAVSAQQFRVKPSLKENTGPRSVKQGAQWVRRFERPD